MLGPAVGESAITSLHLHCTQAQKLADDSDPDRLAFYASDVWRLCLCLWGNLPDLSPDAGKIYF